MSVTEFDNQYGWFESNVTNLEFRGVSPWLEETIIRNKIFENKEVIEKLSTSFIKEIQKRIKISESIKDLLRENKISRLIIQELTMIALRASTIVISQNIPIKEIEISAYDVSEYENFEEWQLYIEIKVPIESLNELFKVWDKMLDILRVQLGDEVIKKYNVYLSRA